MAEKEYIERRIVLKAFSHRISELSDEPIVIGMNEALSLAEEFAENIPAADVAPVKHGHWVSLDDYFEDAQCSECGDALVIGDCSFNDFCECYKYCPNCGAKMDGGSRNE